MTTTRSQHASALIAASVRNCSASMSDTHGCSESEKALSETSFLSTQPGMYTQSHQLNTSISSSQLILQSPPSTVPNMTSGEIPPSPFTSLRLAASYNESMQPVSKRCMFPPELHDSTPNHAGALHLSSSMIPVAAASTESAERSALWFVAPSVTQQMFMTSRMHATLSISLTFTFVLESH
jgi:hypothetical protein